MMDGLMVKKKLKKLKVASQREKGFKIVTGRWLVEGNPQVGKQHKSLETPVPLAFKILIGSTINSSYQVILFDVGSAAINMDAWKQEL